MIKPHYEQTKRRIEESDSKYILAIQDQMRLNFTRHKAKTELGLIGKTGKTEQYGLIQHTVLCATDKNEALGLLDVDHFDYSDLETEVNRDKRAIGDKSNIAWINALNKMRARLGEIQKRVITVADREGDFYEFLHVLVEKNELFVVRSHHDRILGEQYEKEGEKLKTLLKTIPICGSMDVTIQDVHSREIKEITLQLKATEVVIPIPKHIPSSQREMHGYKAIKLNVVVASDRTHEWILLSTLPINTMDQIQEIVEIYRFRWHIEDYHKVLKTGYQVDEIYLHHSKETIKNLLVMASISACRLYWLIYTGRSEVDIKADQLFEEFEWKAMYVYFNEKIPDECPTLSTVILKIARLGGYKPMPKAKPPGTKTLWIGYQQFTIAAQVYRNMSTKT